MITWGLPVPQRVGWTGVLREAKASRHNGQITVGLTAEGGGKPPALHRHGIAALIVQNFYDRACCSSAAFSKGGNSLPRRSARLKIPAQAFGDKEYFSGAFSSKICDKKQAPPPLGSPKVLGIVYDPSEINASPSRHSGVGPSSRFRH